MAAKQWYEAIHATKRFRLGTRKKDITGVEFVYAKGVTSLALGNFVVFNDETYTPVLVTNVPLTGPIAISLSANILATNFSWYMVYGSSKSLPNLKGLVTIDTGSADKVALSCNSGTSGRVQGDAVHAGKMIVGAWAIGISAANVGDAFLDYPALTGVALT